MINNLYNKFVRLAKMNFIFINILKKMKPLAIIIYCPS